MAEAKKKPPRPSAPPKYKKTVKTKPPASMITMRFNRHADEDIDDELDSGLQISITNQDPAKDLEREKVSSNGAQNRVPDHGNSAPEKTSSKPTAPMTSTQNHPVLSSSPLSGHSSSTSTSPKDDPLHSMLDEHDPHDELFNTGPKSIRGKKSRTPSGKDKETGVVKVESQVLSTDDSTSRFGQLSPDEGMDPLSFFSQLMEKEGKGSSDSLRTMDEDSISSASRDEADNGNGPRVDHCGAPEDLEVNLYHYNHPTPDELQDEPVVVESKPAGKSDNKMSFRDLEKSEVDETPHPSEHGKAAEKEARALFSDNGARTVDSDKKTKSPKEMKVFSFRDKDGSGKVIPDSETSETPDGLPAEVVELPPLYLLGSISVVLFVCLIFPMPVFVNGLVAGMLVSFYASLGLIWLNLPPRSQGLVSSSIDDSTALAAPGQRMSVEKVKQNVQEEKVCEVWMNELGGEYNQDTYHITQTQSVFIRLEGHTLRLSTPRQNIPRRALWTDPVAPKVEFVRQRIYDIQGGQVTLLPDGLVNKRLWSKKYPIYIELPAKGKKETRKEVKTAFDDETGAGMDGDDGFVVIKDEECDERTLILFARTGREKEEWFWRLEVAMNHDKLKGSKPIPTLYKEVIFNHNKYWDSEGNLHHVRSDTYDPLAKKGMVDFYKFITKVLPREKDLKEVPIPPVNVRASGVTYASPAPRGRKPEEIIGVTLDSPLAWANALVGRVFWDFLREESWAEIIQNKLQKKLDKLRIPRFIEGLTITDTDLGTNAPIIKRTSPPKIDHRGIWVYLDITYAGSCCITLTTKFNPWKLRGDGNQEDRELEEINPAEAENQPKKRYNNTHFDSMKSGTDETMVYSRERSPRGSKRDKSKRNKKHSQRNVSLAYDRRSESTSAALDSEEEDSAESSDDEPSDENSFSEAGNRPDESVASRASGKFMRYVNRAANSNFFKKATQNKYVKLAFDEVSKTPVELTVEVKELRGTLAVNIPPPPTDRLWYGFVAKPNLWLSAKPKLGAKQISLNRVTDFIEKKLDLEFQKVFVLPNMDDVVIPIMLFDLDKERL